MITYYLCTNFQGPITPHAVPSTSSACDDDAGSEVLRNSKGKKPVTKKKMETTSIAETIQLSSDHESDDNMDDIDNEEDGRRSPIFGKKRPQDSMFVSKPTPKRKCKQEDTLMHVMQKVYERELQEYDNKDLKERDEVAVFAEYVDRQLRDITDRKMRMTLQNKIQNLIFNFKINAENVQENVNLDNSWHFGYNNPVAQNTYQTNMGTQPGTSTSTVKNTPTESVAGGSGQSKTGHETGVKKYTQLQNAESYVPRTSRRLRQKISNTAITSSVLEIPFDNL
jgi:hypothetical protein